MDTKIFKAEICVADVPNRNGRVYPRRVLEEQVAKWKQKAQNRLIFGGIEPKVAPMLSDASHLVTDIFMDGDKLTAEVEMIDTPSGRVLKKLLDDGVSVKFNMAGIGTAKKDEKGVLVIDYFNLTHIYADCERTIYPQPEVVMLDDRTTSDGSS
jgi:hypothetical protein